MAIALTIAGSDSGGGAGIQADLKAFSALGVFGTSVITALTAQNTQGVSAIHDVRVDFIEAQIDAVLSDIHVDAIKIGMLSQSAVIDAVSGKLASEPDMPIVLDPVMVATSGDPLLAESAVGTLKQTLIKRATLITPNLQEAAFLLNAPMAKSDDDMRAQADRLLALGAGAVLLKGGHGGGDEARDLFTDGEKELWLAAPRIETENTHGTGCTLSSAIAAGLAKGLTLETALHEAKDYVTGAIAAADRLNVGHGHGPTHHFHKWW